MNKIRRFLAELFFEQELDQDYWMGIRQGAETTKATIRLQLIQLRDQAPKSKKAGIDAALEQIGEVL
jgi:hypothetical protein